MKKIISLILVIVMVVSGSISVFAVEQKKSVKDDGKQIASLGFEEVIALTPDAKLKVIDQSSQRKVMTVDWTNGVHAKAIQSTLKNGDVQLAITEGNLSNTLVYKSNGDLYLNGSKIVYTDQNIASSIIAPMQMATYHTATPLVGVASDYSVSDSTKKRNIVVDTAICNIGLTVFSVLIGGIPYLVYTITVSSIISGLYDIYKAKNVTEKTIWYTVTIKRYKNNGPATYAFKYSTQFTNSTRAIKYGTPKVEYYTYVI